MSGALAVRMNAVEQQRLFRRYTDNVAAYEAYLRGRSELARVSEDGTRAAVAAFERALALDTTYALARAGLAMASADMHLRFATGAEVKLWGERAQREAARALELDPDLAEAHLARAAVARKGDFDWGLTLEETAKALELNPTLDLARYFRAAAFYHLGLVDRAEHELRQVQGVDSQNRAEQLRTTGVVAFLQGRSAEAVRYLEETRHSSSRAYADSYLSQAYFYAGDTLRSFQILDSLRASASTPASMRARSSLASFLAFRGDRTGAERLIGEVIANDTWTTTWPTASAPPTRSSVGSRRRGPGWTGPSPAASPAIRGTRAIRYWSPSAGIAPAARFLSGCGRSGTPRGRVTTEPAPPRPPPGR